MPKHETRNTFLLNELESKYSVDRKFGQFMLKLLSKIFTKSVARKLVPGPFEFIEN